MRPVSEIRLIFLTPPSHPQTTWRDIILPLPYWIPCGAALLHCSWELKKKKQKTFTVHLSKLTFLFFFFFPPVTEALTDSETAFIILSETLQTIEQFHHQATSSYSSSFAAVSISSILCWFIRGYNDPKYYSFLLYYCIVFIAQNSLVSTPGGLSIFSGEATVWYIEAAEAYSPTKLFLCSLLFVRAWMNLLDSCQIKLSVH